MQYCCVSDLHADHTPLDLEIFKPFAEETNTVVVAGDIANRRNHTMAILRKLRKMFENVLYVPGNHCFYELASASNIDTSQPDNNRLLHDVADYYDWYGEACKNEGILYLHRLNWNIDGVNFCGATGWHTFDWGSISTEMQRAAWQRCMRDSAIVWDKTYPEHFERYDPIGLILKQAKEDAKAIVDNLHPEIPNVVVTHHIPHHSFTVEKPGDMIWNCLNGSFYSSFLEQVAIEHADKIHLFQFGHTHFRWDRTIGKTRFVCNPRGYQKYGENPNWKPILVSV